MSFFLTMNDVDLITAPLSLYTTLRIGGPAKALCIASSADDVIRVAGMAGSMGLPWQVIGHGSNILAADAGVDKAVIVFKGGDKPRAFADGSIVVSGGYSLSEFVKHCASAGLDGLEDLAGIPGTVGGAITGNAGAYGTAIGDRVLSVKLLDKNGRVRNVPGERLGFSYRSSVIKGTGDAVLEAVLSTKPGKREILMARIEERLADRAKKHPDPKVVPTAGSWFKNPKDEEGKTIAAGKLLEAAGCKSLKVGGAYVWQNHANIIVTDGHAKARDVMELSETMARRVADKFGIVLEREVVFLM